MSLGHMTFIPPTAFWLATIAGRFSNDVLGPVVEEVVDPDRDPTAAAELSSLAATAIGSVSTALLEGLSSSFNFTELRELWDISFGHSMKGK
mmetsp:Transcript_60684/g.130315  ORF Transcript_60684/g.130315 Transcript_60684/m.130315 type:complete len:92 (+) Transcript_60684:320-595(+)